MRGYIVGALVFMVLGGWVYDCNGHRSSQHDVFGSVEEVRLVVAGQPSYGNDNTGNVITGALAGGAIAQTVGGSDLVLPGAAVGAAIAGSDTVRGQILAAQVIVVVNNDRVLFKITDEGYTANFGLMRQGDTIPVVLSESRDSPFISALTTVRYEIIAKGFDNMEIHGVVLPPSTMSK